MYCLNSKKKRYLGVFRPKAQISVFMIIGILLVIAGAVFSYVLVTKYRESSGREIEEITETGVLPPLDVYIQRCIDLESPPVIFKLAEQGGVLLLKEGSYLYYNKEKLSYLCSVEGPSIEYACRNSFLTRQEMQRILSKEIANSLRKCINLKPFEAQGYKIEEGLISVRSRIGKKSVLVELNYPINLTKEGQQISVSDFSSDIKLPLGELYEIAMDIINREIGSGYFDADKFMTDNGANVIIEKHRPYPDIVYILSEDVGPEFKRDKIRFQFALQQNPSVAQRRMEQKELYGLCRNDYDGMCFQNVPEAYCRDVEGIYNPSKGISCVENYRQPFGKPELCNGHECMSCEYDFWGKKLSVPKKHGESWCVYDGITGNGYDYAGSRHYKHSCVDGNVYVEECRDYREELCTENTVDGLNKAVCRVNRWYDCSYCETEQCCNDLNYRDCFWNYELTTDQKCVPYAPPGLRFWENEGIDICLRANNKKDCEGISCPNVWIDDAARYCYQQADCGNYRNIADQLTYYGFFQSDPSDSVRDTVYLPAGWNKNPLDDKSYWSINLPLDARKQKEMIEVRSDVSPVFGNIPLMISAGLQFIDEIVNLDITDFLNPFRPMPRIHIVDFGLCSVWGAPLKKGYCVLCSADPAKPCTEYRCKSLGERCEFSMDEGVPKCELPSLVDKEAPKISLNREALTEGYKTEDAELAGNEGYKITPAIIPHKPFTFGIKTNELTRCSLKLSPRFEYFSMPSFWLNDPSFKTEHNLTLRMPPRLIMPQKLLNFLNITSTSDIIPFLENLGPLYESYKEKLKDKLALYKTVTGQDLVEMIDPQVKRAINFISGMTPYLKTVVKAMIDEFGRGGYYIFVECTDKAGNINKDEFFVQFEIDSDYVDNDSPKIVYALPQNNSMISKTENKVEVSLYVDEPAECRYSDEDKEFGSMEKSFFCQTGYHISPVEGGTYECTAAVDRSIYSRIFVRCMDRPFETDNFELKLVKGNETRIMGIEKLNHSNISASTYIEMNENNGMAGIEVPANIMQEFAFKTEKFPIDLRIYLPENKECRYSNTTKSFREMTGKFGMCRISDMIERGVYECDAVIEEPLFSNSIGNYTLKIARSDEYGVVSGSVSEGMDINVNGGKIKVSSDEKMSGESNVKINTADMELEVEIAKGAKCRYSQDSTSMADMSCAAYDGGNKTICKYSSIIGDNSDIYVECISTSEERSHTIHIGCSDINATEGNTNNESYVYMIRDAEPLNITVRPSGIITEKETDLIVGVSGSIDEDGIVCGYNENPFLGLLKMEKIASDRFGEHLTGFEEGKKYRYYVQCDDKYRNNAEGYTEFEVAG